MRKPIWKNNSGATFLDYLLVTVVISAVAFPVMYSQFGAPLLDMMTRGRAQMVGFIAQNPPPSRPVPDAWFGLERPKDVAEPAAMDPGRDVSPPRDTGPGQLTPGQQIADARAINNPGAISSGELRQPGQISSGSINQPSSIGGAGRGGTGQGGGTVGGRSTSLGDDSKFFSGSAAEKGEKGREENATSNTRQGYGRASGGASGGEEETEQTPGTKTKSDRKDNSEQKSKAREDEEKRQRSRMELGEIEQNRAKRRGGIDWWLILKLLLIILIIFLVILIGLSTTKRT